MLMCAVHPGEILKEDLAEMGVTPFAFARQINVPPIRISQLIAGKRSITGDMALRLGHWFRVGPQFWVNLQTQYDLAKAEKTAGAEIRKLPTATPRKRRCLPLGPKKRPKFRPIREVNKRGNYAVKRS